MKPGVCLWASFALLFVLCAACEGPETAKTPPHKAPEEARSAQKQPEAPQKPPPAEVPNTSEVPELPPDFRAEKPKPDVEGGQPTSETPQTLKVGPWSIVHSHKEGIATHAATRERVSLWRADPRDCVDYKLEGRLVSVVGAVVSFDLRESGRCTPPAAGTAFHTLDLARPGPQKASPLSEHFDEAEIKAALDGHPWLTNARSRADLFKCIYKEADLTGDHFAFHAIKAGKVVVRIGVGHGCEAQLGLFTQLDIELTPSPDQLKALESAQELKTLSQHLHSILQ